MRRRNKKVALPTLVLPRYYDHGRCENQDCNALLEPPVQILTVTLYLHLNGGKRVEEVRRLRVCSNCYRKFNRNEFYVEIVDEIREVE